LAITVALAELSHPIIMLMGSYERPFARIHRLNAEMQLATQNQ
jgi:hypothetical protein